MNELKIFTSEEFGEIRTVTIDDEPWFVASDICKALEIGNTSQSLTRLDDDEKRTTIISNEGAASGKSSMSFINEYGLYSLVLASRKPQAKDFKRWITHEVLPSIRKNGGYIAGQETLSDDELMAKALLVAQNKIAERDKVIMEKQEQIDQMKPKEIFADAVSASHSSILVGELAKLIKQNGYDIGQNRLFAWMRENGYLISRKGIDYNMPTQRSMEHGLFEIKESTSVNPDGSIRTNKTPKVTGKGQQYFVNKFLSR